MFLGITLAAVLDLFLEVIIDLSSVRLKFSPDTSIVEICLRISFSIVNRHLCNSVKSLIGKVLISLTWMVPCK